MALSLTLLRTQGQSGVDICESFYTAYVLGMTSGVKQVCSVLVCSS